MLYIILHYLTSRDVSGKLVKVEDHALSLLYALMAYKSIVVVTRVGSSHTEDVEVNGVLFHGIEQ